jgi:cytochrome c1
MTTPMIPATAASIAASLFRQLDEQTARDLSNYLASVADSQGATRASLVSSLRLALDAEIKKGDESVDLFRKREADGRKPS